jgi:putative ABC transport system permease protein
MRRAAPPPVRLGIALYTVLLRAMPPRYRRDFGSDTMADVAELLDEASRLKGRTVVGTTLRACLDLLARLPGEWWATVRSAPVASGWGDRYGSPGMRETTMNVTRELAQAARTLAKRPGFTAIAVLTLALGIGANVAIFSIVNAVLLRPLPYQESDQIVEIRHHAPGLDFPELRNSEGMLAFYRENADFLRDLAGFRGGSANLTGDDEAVRVRVADLDPEVMGVLRVRPAIGRPFNADDAAPGAAAVVILGHDTWEARFGSDPSLVGRTIRMDGEAVEVVGVMPEGFAFPDADVEVYTVLRDVDVPQFGAFGLNAIARLDEGIAPEVAQARLTELFPRIQERFPDMGPAFLESAAFSVTVGTLRDRMVMDVEATLWIIVGTVAFVLLIACANVANLFLVRAESRQKEMAVRAAMGAGRKSVAVSFLSESLLLGIGGGIVGVLLASGGVRTLLAATDLPRAAEVSVDAASLGLAALLSVTAGLVFGAFPMTRYAGRRFAQILRDGGRGSTSGRERHRARNALVASQLALALILLIGSGLMLRSFAELRAIDIGFEPDGVLTMGLNRNSGEDAEVAARFYENVAERVAALPGVAEVGITNNLPLASDAGNGGSFYVEGEPREEGDLPPVAMYRAVGASYFTSLGIPIVRGRAIERADWEEARRVLVVNETFERLHLDGDALGKRLTWDTGGPEDPDDASPWAEVVGVVADVRELGLTDEAVRPFAYFPLRIDGTVSIEVESVFLTIAMHDGQSPTALAPAVEAAVRELDANVPITATRTMSDIVDAAMEDTSLTMSILGVATFMALFLGAIGLAGVISYVVGQRTREIGVRVALGATTTDVRDMILRQSLVVTVVGTVLGLVGALGLTRLMGALLYEVSTTDPVAFIAAPVVLVVVSLLATWLPVRKATRVDPTEALRAE